MGATLVQSRVASTISNAGGRACLVCGKRERLEETRARVGYVDGKPVFIHSYCSGAWQNAAVRVR
jgi:hypothetical protein